MSEQIHGTLTVTSGDTVDVHALVADVEVDGSFAVQLPVIANGPIWEPALPVKNVGFGAAPSFFRANMSGVKSNPAKVAERRAAEQRLLAFNQAIHGLRAAADALHRFKAMDSTGHLVAGIEHFDAHVRRAEEASETVLAMAENFAKQYEL